MCWKEYPFFTVKSFPPGFIVHLGGVVSARSVKLLDKIHNPGRWLRARVTNGCCLFVNDILLRLCQCWHKKLPICLLVSDEPETRDVWWAELRTEIRSHMRAMGCHAVVGYSEQTSIRDELIILSAIGTATVVNLNFSLSSAYAAASALSHSQQQSNLLAVQSAAAVHQSTVADADRSKHHLHVDVNLANQASSNGALRRTSDCRRWAVRYMVIPHFCFMVTVNSAGYLWTASFIGWISFKHRLRGAIVNLLTYLFIGWHYILRCWAFKFWFKYAATSTMFSVHFRRQQWRCYNTVFHLPYSIPGGCFTVSSPPQPMRHLHVSWYTGGIARYYSCASCII